MVPASPVGAEGAFGEEDRDYTPVAAMGAPEPPAARRRPRWQMHAEAIAETWLPPRARLVGAAAAVVGVLVGFGATALIVSTLRHEPSTRRTIVVRSTPPGAVVNVNDERLARSTPVIADVDLADGAHTVTLAIAAGAPAQRTVTLTSTDRSLQLSENLQSTGSVRIESRPSGARVSLDGRDVGMAPIVVPAVSTDRPHVVEGRRPGFKTATASVPVTRPAELLVMLTLEAQKQGGRIVLSTALPASIEMDGALWGMTSSAERECGPGRHDVVVRIAALGIEKHAVIDVPERGVVRYFISLD